MSYRIRVVLGAIAALAFAGIIALVASQRTARAAEVTVYKSPTCGCCTKWVQHLERNGFEVNAIDVRDLVPVKMKHGVSPTLASCHTALVGGYVVEGHVPADVIERLLRERPDVQGIAVPGMPVGSPGMEQGGRKDPYSVVTFDAQGETRIYERL